MSKVFLGTQYPIRDLSVVNNLLASPERSPWYWFQLANGDLMVGFYPQAEMYSECEPSFTEDWQAAEAAGTLRVMEADAEEGAICDRHGGSWGNDPTCDRCTYEDGRARPVADPGPLPGAR